MSSTQEPTGAGRQPTTPVPTVSPAPADEGRSRWWPRSVPDHIGRARTSTAVLVLLFVALFALWIWVRPDTTSAATTPTSPTTGVEQPGIIPPVTTTDPSPTTTPPPTTGTTPTRTTTRTTTSPSTPASEEPTTEDDGTATTPAPTTTRPGTSSAPTSAAPTS